MQRLETNTPIFATIIALLFVSQGEPPSTRAPKAPVVVSIEDKESSEKAQPSSLLCSCVKYARSRGVPIPMNTDAVDMVGNSIPMEGGLVLLTYPKADHVAVIVSLEEEYMVIDEANYKRCKHTQRRIPYSSKHIKGFWYEQSYPHLALATKR